MNIIAAVRRRYFVSGENINTISRVTKYFTSYRKKAP
jgi:hypothetical protein